MIKKIVMGSLIAGLLIWWANWSSKGLDGCVKFQNTYIPRTVLVTPSNYNSAPSGHDQRTSINIRISIDDTKHIVQLYGKYARKTNGFHDVAIRALKDYGPDTIKPEPYAVKYHRLYYASHEGEMLPSWYMINSIEPPIDPNVRWALALCSERTTGSPNCIYSNMNHKIHYVVTIYKDYFSRLEEIDRVISDKLKKWEGKCTS
ncbi:hypothetical protein [Catenovulum maritimum]|uniref:Uncharacterized protein n=1 Tax=Catenovulum maritimum TaxID=1513271 RepID=A0A0J8GQL8_9ALTE|nr:hypothetical protein [Catenovulum maritimum]KMT65080.1 hypothetical protein XM47_11485 [Catenovulum maritimum]